MITDIEHLFMYLLATVCLLWKTVYSVTLPILKTDFFFPTELYEIFNIF